MGEEVGSRQERLTLEVHGIVEACVASSDGAVASLAQEGAGANGHPIGRPVRQQAARVGGENSGVQPGQRPVEPAQFPAGKSLRVGQAEVQPLAISRDKGGTPPEARRR